MVSGNMVALEASNRWQLHSLVADVLIIALPCPSTRPFDEVFPRSPIIDYIREHNSDGHRVYDPSLMGSYHVSLLGTGQSRGIGLRHTFDARFQPARCCTLSTVSRVHRECWRPSTAFAGEFTHPVSTDFDVANASLFDFLGVRYSRRSGTLRQSSFFGIPIREALSSGGPESPVATTSWLGCRICQRSTCTTKTNRNAPDLRRDRCGCTGDRREPESCSS